MIKKKCYIQVRESNGSFDIRSNYDGSGFVLGETRKADVMIYSPPVILIDRDKLDGLINLLIVVRDGVEELENGKD